MRLIQLNLFYNVLKTTRPLPGWSRTILKYSTSAQSPSDDHAERTLLINKLSFTLTEEDIVKAFKPIGGVSKVKIERDIKNPDSATESIGKSKGYGQIEFETAELAKQALHEMQGLVLNNLPITIRPLSELKVSTSSNQAGYHILYIRNLPYSTTESDIMDVFGPLQAIRCGLARAPITQYSLGYGFIRFSNAEAAVKALRVTKGTMFKDRRAKISLAKPESHGYKYIV
ncbi:hypothetical protein CANARDRAFT_6324 [[Candida] arabinofermentans NRRL YB-2248]|uniref:RRM domain-containing protein n=1 Tax=[Candida] arabinofermentans NRRL YB-2248 TaxID=983967 RepID=A0A1E4T4U9_9ASCO|nr:hypothetical protein CANARDRAFT_6324 [[Candida] arabinofermentans NRRL YB-2248]